MKKKPFLLILFLTLTLSACAETPEDSLVKRKGAMGEDLYEEAASETTETSIRDQLNAPETYKSEVKDETGKLTLSTDAKVEIPDVTKISAIAVSQHPCDQGMIDKVSETFFPGAKFYESGSYFQMTKEDLEKKISMYKGYLAEGNLDPNGFGTDENGNYYFDINSVIDELEEQYQRAPEKREPVEVKPQLGLEVKDYEGTSGTWVNENGFSGVAVTPEGKEYQYYVSNFGENPMLIQLADLNQKGRKESVEANTYSHWSEYGRYKFYEDMVENLPDEEQLKEQETRTLEEACALAEEKINGLGIKDMELASWDYGLYLVQPNNGKERIYDIGYILHYTRKPENLPVTYTENMGGMIENPENYMETWCYEAMDFCIGSDGLSEVGIRNLYDIGETKTEQVKLKSFDEIMKIYEKMMLIQNSAFLENAKQKDIKIDRITLGYTRIYEPLTSARTGILVPAWDFFGSDSNTQTNEEDGSETTYHNAFKDTSYLTINAIDGSIIDRNLGY